jgi:hypothetical protein
MDATSVSCASTTVKRRLKSVTYICQIIAIFAVIVVCLINLSVGDEKSALWSSMLSGSLGYLLPAPKDDSLLSNSPVEQLQEVLSGQYDDEIHNTSTVNCGTIGGLGGGASGNDVHSDVVYNTEDER